MQLHLNCKYELYIAKMNFIMWQSIKHIFRDPNEVTEMNVFIKRVKSAIGKDGLDDGVCVFEKVIDYLITLKNIEEEDDDEVVSPTSNKKATFKSALYNVLHSIRRKLRNSSDSDTKAISYSLL